MTVPSRARPTPALLPAVPRRRPAVLRGRAARLVLVVIVVAALLATAVLAFSDGSAPGGPPTVAPLRVTAGGEVATGFAVGRDRVVTVSHLVDAAVKADGADAGVRVRGIRAKRVRWIRAQVLRADRRSDLALLAARGIAGRLPGVAAVGAGDDVRVLRLRGGRPSSLAGRVRRAIVAHVRVAGAERAVTRPAVELAARVEPGDSGAPVVTRSGALAGVVFAASSGRADTAYAVDASAVVRLLARE